MFFPASHPGLDIYSYCISCCCRVFFILCPLAWISCLRDSDLINFRGFYSLFKCNKMHITSIYINIVYVQVFAGKDVRLSTCFGPKLSFESPSWKFGTSKVGLGKACEISARDLTKSGVAQFCVFKVSMPFTI